MEHSTEHLNVFVRYTYIRPKLWWGGGGGGGGGGATVSLTESDLFKWMALKRLLRHTVV